MYEYTNELSVRDHIEFILSAVSPELGAALAADIRSIDTDFSEATQESPRPMFGARRMGAWWWQRVPKKLVGELAETAFDEPA